MTSCVCVCVLSFFCAGLIFYVLKTNESNERDGIKKSQIKWMLLFAFGVILSDTPFFVCVYVYRFYSMCRVNTCSVWCSFNGIPKWIITKWIWSCWLLCLLSIDGYFGYLNVFCWLSGGRSSKFIEIFSQWFDHITFYGANQWLSRFTQSKLFIALQ